MLESIKRSCCYRACVATIFAGRLSLVLIGGMASAGVTSAFAQNPIHTVVDFDADSPRPFNDALTAIEEQLRVPVNYEEAVITDRQHLVKGEEIGLAPGRFYQKGGRLTIHYVPGEGDAMAAVGTAVSAYERSGLPGSYKVTREGSMIAVVPLTAAPLFETKITLSKQDRTIPDLVEELAQQVSKVSGKRIVLLNQPYTTETKFSIAAQNEPLWRVFEQVNDSVGPTSFRFIYEPSTSIYYLNLNAVRTVRPEDLPELPTASSQIHGRPTSSPFFVKTKP